MLNWQIGKKYRKRNGETCIMKGFDSYICQNYGRVVRFEDGSSCWEVNGRVYYSHDRPNDIIEEVNEMKIEVGKWYKTRGGAKVFIGMHVPRGKTKPYVGYQVIENDVYFCDMCWYEDGSFATANADHHANIVEEWKEPKSGVVYANIYSDHNTDYVYMNRTMADDAARYMVRLACVRVEWKEGQFDE